MMLLFFCERNKNYSVNLLDMRASLILLILAFAHFHKTSAQSFYYFQTNGELPAEYDLNRVTDSFNTKQILFQQTNDYMSPSQAISFPFEFNGIYYNNYRVSENGYISFNTNNTISYKPDSGFINLNQVKNTLMPFWYDFRLKKLPFPNQEFPIKVFSYNEGVSPNRKHIIQFYGLTKASDSLTGSVTNADVFAFAIILYEGTSSRFDFVYNFFGRNNIKGIAGYFDNSNIGKMIRNKPIAFPVALSADKNNTIVYQFHAGIQPKQQLYVKQNLLASNYKIKEAVIVSSKISNIGSDTVYNFNYQYRVDGNLLKDTIQLNHTINALLPFGENTLTIAHSKPWSSGSAGSINKIACEALLQPDSLNKDSSYYRNISSVLRILGVHPLPRNVLLEISTGGWCGYCPNAHYVAEEAQKTMKTGVIPVMHHFGDPMETIESNKVNTTYQKGYPYGLIDRKFFTGQSNGWQNILNIEKVDSSNIEINILKRNFDEVTRLITYTLQVKFHDYLLGNYRVGTIITENNVRGYISPSQWSQNNYYSKDYNGGVAGGSSHPYYNELHYMDGYLHQYVVIGMPMGAWGKENSLPGFIKPNDVFNFDVSYTLPATTQVDYNVDNNTKYCSTIDDPGQNDGMYKPNDISVVGFVAEYQENAYIRSILNANSNGLLFENTSVKNVETHDGFNAFPNPASNQINIHLAIGYHLKGTIEIINALGNIVASEILEEAEVNKSIDISKINSGVYLVKCIINGDTYFQKLSIIK